MTTISVNSEPQRQALLREIGKFKTPFLVDIKKGGTRSLSQNRYLWGLVYPTILEQGGLEGWTVNDLHEYFLGEHFGWEKLTGFGRTRIRPINRSSRLTKMEFVDYVAFIQQKAAEMGVLIPDPE